ncbi:hypothetical protein [Nostoc sp. DSM 114161]
MGITLFIEQFTAFDYRLMTNDPSGSPVAHGGNPQDPTGSPMTND